MLTLRKLVSIILFSILLTGVALAQNEPTAQEAKLPAPAVAVSASGDAVRFTSAEQVLQLRLEIYSASGESIYDSGFHQGNILDWKIANVPQGVTDGSYLCVVTIKDLRGRTSQRFGSIAVQAGQVTASRTREDELTPAQSQALAASRKSQKIESAGSDTALTILRDGKTRAVTVTAHDGQDGQVTSTSGALTFRTGDIFSNRAKEQMRITPEGRVGIGTDNPEATLDVAGPIRARGGIVFDDGTVLNSAQSAAATTSKTNVIKSSSTFNLAGTGTTNTMTKWTDSAGTLGDSAMTEVGGNVGIGTTTPSYKLVVGPDFAPGLAWAATTVSKGAGQSASIVIGPDRLHAVEFGWDNTTSRAVMNAPGTNVIAFTQGGINERLRIHSNGFIGIGTSNPQSVLDVAGDVHIGGAGNGLIFPDGTKMTTASTGGTMTGTSIVSAINAAGTTGLISETRLSPNVAKLNTQNAWTGQNTFVNGLSANGVAITNVGNPVSATDATNKAYVDANTVRFVPGAEQLSVGDANGTAPMINLRGGSTCCSGPGGHTPAWFKVFQNGSFVATGNLGIGVSPMQGKGYRTSWDSYKGAFRSGYADAEWDDANVGFFSWAGGSNSTAIGLYALAFGDTNSAESTSSIVFGSGNQVKGAAGFSAGAGNRVCDTYGVALGNNAKSGGPLINGKCDPDTFNIRGLAAVAIGYNVTADQDHTTAMGKFASNNGFTGTFIWSDGSAQQSADTFRNTANNEFAVRATGGVRFRTNLGGTTGCNLPAGSGVFNCTSSRYTKENFLIVKGEDILSTLRGIPVSTWNYISEGRQVRHMGPMAEDFYQAFRLGTGNTSIGVQDLAGVSLAAVKALEERTAQLQQKIAEVEQLRSQLNTLEQRFAALEKFMQTSGQQTTEAH
ncbi:MAG TPA: tail fiber domain-containing protein [Pyrinomonadaceae bacterium]